MQITSDLKKGMNGSQEVFELQLKLHSLGYYPGGPDSPINGNFGEETENSVKQFQERNGLQVTGIVNQATADAIDDAHRCEPEVTTDETKAQDLALNRLAVYRRFQEEAKKNLELCASISPIAIEYNRLLKAQGYNERERAGLIAEQAVWWGNLKGIDALAKLQAALGPAFESILGLAEEIKRVKAK